jgi:hypothetical protein
MAHEAMQETLLHQARNDAFDFGNVGLEVSKYGALVRCELFGSVWRRNKVRNTNRPWII